MPRNVAATVLRCALLCPAVIASQSPVAWAKRPSAAPAASAADYHRRGVRLYDLERFAEAIAAFERAYELGGDPEQLYNLAQAHRRAGHAPKALEFYRTYLRHRPDAPNREEVEERIATLERTIGPPNQPAPAAPLADTSGAAPPVAEPPPFGHAPPVQAPYGYGSPPAAHPPGPNAWSGAPPAVPPAAAGPRGHQTHDGFYLRLALGGGGLSATRGDGLEEISAGGALLAIAAGWALTERLVLYAEVQRLATSDEEQPVALTGFGGGAAYYFASNVFLYGTLSAFDLSVTPDGGDSSTFTEPGAGFSLGVGKEWWVSSNWGVGASLQVTGASLEDSRAGIDDARWSVGTVSLLLSATYN